MSNNQKNAKKGVFITFEGGDGAGKSTHIKLLSERLKDKGREVLIIREPGGTKIGEAIREMLLGKETMEMTPETELLLFEASRAQIVQEVIMPAIERGVVVLCDRFFDSSLAYQGYGRGLSVDFIKAANAFATRGLLPDRTVFLKNNSAEEALKRATQESGADRIEMAGSKFHEDVSKGFMKIIEENPERFRVVEFQEAKEDTAKLVYESVIDIL